MRDTSPRPWKRWRVTLAATTFNPVVDRLDRLLVTAPAPTTASEQPGPDGIRHELVARIRREIAAGTYDTEEKWLAAEEELLRRVEEAM